MSEDYRRNLGGKQLGAEPQGEEPPASPYLVIQATEFDLGSRPIPEDQAKHSISIEILDEAGAKVDTAAGEVKADKSYKVRCSVTNLGTAGVLNTYMTLSVGPPTLLDTAAASGGILPVYDVNGLTKPAIDAAPGERVTIDFAVPVVLGTSGSTPSVLVQVNDPLDPITKPFDAERDRHVGRLDIPPIA